jgi:Sulfatase
MKGHNIVNRKFSTAAWPLLAAAAILCAVAPAKAAEQKPNPNIVFMFVDNLGYGELGVYGGGILRGAPTPRIDKLASDGMRLLNFNVESQCTASRSALMTGRFPIRSGTYKVPLGGIPDGLTLWEVTVAELLSARGYATSTWGKWHLGSAEARFPTHQGFDEWYGIPRTYDEAMWPSLNETHSMWPSLSNKQGWNANVVPPESIYEAHKGEKARQVAELNVDRRRTMDAEITSHTVDFIKRNANATKPFYAYVSFSLVHFPTLPNPEFAGKQATAIGPIVWPSWTTALDKFWTRSRKQASKRTPSSSLPATTVQRRPTRGMVTADHGAVRISRRWKPHYVCRDAGASLPLWRRTVGRRGRRGARTRGWPGRQRHRLAGFARSQLLHGLLQLGSRVRPHVDVLRNGPIPFEAQRDGVASGRRVQSLEGSVEVVCNACVVTVDVHLGLLRLDFRPHATRAVHPVRISIGIGISIPIRIVRSPEWVEEPASDEHSTVEMTARSAATKVSAAKVTTTASLWCRGDRRRQRKYEHRRQDGCSRDGIYQWPHVRPLSDAG